MYNINRRIITGDIIGAEKRIKTDIEMVGGSGRDQQQQKQQLTQAEKKKFVMDWCEKYYNEDEFNPFLFTDILSDVKKLYQKYDADKTNDDALDDLYDYIEENGEIGGEYPYQNGEGIKDYLKNKYRDVKAIFNGRDRLEPKSRRIVEKYGDESVVGITLKRDPIAGYIRKIIDLLLKSKGSSLAQLLEKYNYDSLFHLYSELKLSNGATIVVEKNETVNILEGSRPVSKDGSELIVEMGGKSPILNEMLEKTIKRMGERDFYYYSASQLNCQNFLINFLASSGLMQPEYKKFILQDAAAIYSELPEFVKSVSDLATTIADKANIAVYGSGQQTITKQDIKRLIESAQSGDELLAIYNGLNLDEYDANRVGALDLLFGITTPEHLNYAKSELYRRLTKGRQGRPPIISDAVHIKRDPKRDDEDPTEAPPRLLRI